MRVRPHRVAAAAPARERGDVTESHVSPQKARSATRWTAAFAVLPALAIGAVLYATATAETQAKTAVAGVVEAPNPVIAGITAPVPSATPDAASYAQRIDIILPPPPPPPPASSSGKKVRDPQAASAAAAAGDHLAFCDAGGGAIATATTLDGLVAAANQERARFGYGPLTWSGSLAQASQGWANQLVLNDEATAAAYDAIAHNPNRPAGGENVAMSYKSKGLSAGTALSKAHAGWMASYTHCKNLLNPKWSVMGAGMAQTADGTTWYTVANYQ